MSKRRISFIMMTYVDRVHKKILRGSALSHLLLKSRAIKVDSLVSKEPLWTDQVMLVPYASAVRSNVSIQIWTCPIYDRDNWQIYKSRNGPLEKSRNVLQICKRIKFTCSLIRSMVTLISSVIQTLFLQGVWILKFPRYVTSSLSHMELYRGKAP